MGQFKAHAVIGAGYGDEGKGLAVDAIARRLGDAVVVRSNGGAQAGHTVTTDDGRRHVFHHFGAGALAGAESHLSRLFVCHPMMFLEERVRLAALCANISVSVDPRAPVTTPFDVMVNQAVETARGNGRHGSCGLGFGETLERNLRADLALDVAGLRDPELKARLRDIRDRWVPERLAALGVSAMPQALAAAMADERVIDVFVGECEMFLDAVHLRSDASLGRRGTVLFEGAQGLMLDQDAGAFPYVTRSNTGLKNMLAIAGEAGIGRIEVTYVTRAYVTRHGAGPMAAETAGPDGFEVVDPTNVPNPWQGTIRYGNLDAGVLAAAIRTDLGHAVGHPVAVDPGFAVTCLDQAIAEVPVVKGDEILTLDPMQVPDVLAAWLALPCRATSTGPTAKTFAFANTTAVSDRAA